MKRGYMLMFPDRFTVCARCSKWLLNVDKKHRNTKYCKKIYRQRRAGKYRISIRKNEDGLSISDRGALLHDTLHFEIKTSVPTHMWWKLDSGKWVENDF